MATAVVMPTLGNTVESCIIVDWKKSVGDSVKKGESICEVETDKAVMEVESPATGILLARFYAEGEDVPVQTAIAVIGQPGEDFSHLRPEGAPGGAAGTGAPVPPADLGAPARESPADSRAPAPASPQGVSPRARNLAMRKGVDVSSLRGTGPGGRIVERDVQSALAAQPRLTPVAQAMVAQGDYVIPERGSGPGGRVTARDLIPVGPAPHAPAPAEAEEPVRAIPIKGVRKIIAERMLSSLQTTAQLTLNTSADARALLQFRKRCKTSPEVLGLREVTINDLILFAVSRTLPQHRYLNALFQEETVYEYVRVHLGLAVDTPRGLLVPVIRDADRLSLRELSSEAKRLAAGAQDGHLSPDELSGGTFTVTNLGNLGIESFTPVLNVPQVGILGVGNINPKPVELEGEIQFVPHINLSLTVNHQVVDGAPAARFLNALSQSLANIDLLLAV
jgi:pyruvate dehydrogenase E2 component (dihydrolipoamide acetyltransferase)